MLFLIPNSGIQLRYGPAIRLSLSLRYTYAKRGAKSCHSFHVLRPSHCPFLPKRATIKAPRRCDYIIYPHSYEHTRRSKPMRAVYNTPHETSSLLCSWQEVESLRSSNTSKPKRQITPVVCMPPHQPILKRTFRREDSCKSKKSYWYSQILCDIFSKISHIQFFTWVRDKK